MTRPAFSFRDVTNSRVPTGADEKCRVRPHYDRSVRHKPRNRRHNHCFREKPFDAGTVVGGRRPSSRRTPGTRVTSETKRLGAGPWALPKVQGLKPHATLGRRTLVSVPRFRHSPNGPVGQCRPRRPLGRELSPSVISTPFSTESSPTTGVPCRLSLYRAP